MLGQLGFARALTAMVSSVMGGSQGIAESNFSSGTQSDVSPSSVCVGHTEQSSTTVSAAVPRDARLTCDSTVHDTAVRRVTTEQWLPWPSRCR